jgi:hypothetical protein
MVSLLLIKTSKYFSNIFREKFIKVYRQIKFSRGKNCISNGVRGEERREISWLLAGVWQLKGVTRKFRQIFRYRCGLIKQKNCKYMNIKKEKATTVTIQC